MDQHPILLAFRNTYKTSQENKKGNRYHDKTQESMIDSKLNWFLQKGIDKGRDLILKIIGINDILESYYCNGNIESVKKYIKYIEVEIYNFFQLKEFG